MFSLIAARQRLGKRKTPKRRASRGLLRQHTRLRIEQLEPRVLLSASGSVQGTVFADLDSDSVHDRGEPGVRNVAVKVLLENGYVEAAAKTDHAGRYTFDTLPPDDYIVRVLVPDGFAHTLPDGDGTYQITVGQDDRFSNLDFGLIDLRGSISGTVFKDLNRDGVVDPGEKSAWAGERMRLDLVRSDGSVARSVRAGVDGKYSFPEVAPGDYVVRVRMPDGCYQTAPVGEHGYGVSIVDSEVLRGLDFGIADQRGSLSGIMFEDLNGNGTRDPAEPAVSRHRVELRSVDGGTRRSARTDDDGRYVIDQVAPGSYLVDSRLPDGYATHNGRDTYEVTIVDGDCPSGLDFAVVDAFELPTLFESPDEMEQLFIAAALAKYDHLFGQPGNPFPEISFRDDMVGIDVSLGAFTAGGFSVDYSQTNTQVDGVDEGDLVETDGRYLYILANEELVIVDTKGGRKLRLASRVEFDGRPFAQYLTGDRLTVLWNSWAPVSDGSLYATLPEYLTVTVFDVSDRQAPTI
ncbi:MAG: carboxypeptidase regulatory-like domain-containing protein, partial [Planctomycetes bacterium]|nr:carboxypeptidase regulatory-like domain-containing protein [Planctomycetota bacterium]